ncbi:hypothetical protein [Paenibacillus paridis]|uniref:hypothetical protein n=1 Tax=Paenibacillus paridis TaxID=2583376 RepID=UPI00111EDD2B|nr:hypothetical protein [Paenibacillus paridis]
MNKKVQTKRLNEAIQKLQTAKGLIKTKRLNHAKSQIHEAVSSCDYIVNTQLSKKRTLKT